MAYDNIEALADAIEGAEYMNTGGNVMVAYIPDPGAEYPVGWLVGEGLSEDTDFTLGRYESEDDEGVIVKEWSAEGLSIDEHADIVRACIATY